MSISIPELISLAKDKAHTERFSSSVGYDLKELPVHNLKTSTRK